jgi:hypothetical protein
VSDATGDDRPGKAVRLSKTTSPDGSAVRAALATGPAPSLPITIKLAVGAVIIEIIALVVEAFGLRGHTRQLQDALITSNAKLKKPKSPYGLSGAGLTAVNKDLSSLRTQAVLQAVVIGIALLLVMVLLTRARSAGLARWALIIVAVLSRAPLAVIPYTQYPAVPKAANVIFGVASIVSIVALFLSPSMQYFRACRAYAHPGAPTGRPGLFGPRPIGPRTPAGRAATAPAPAAPVADGGGATNGAAGAGGRQRAKVRADEAAVARGADLARSRAKAAAKSRRIEG